MSTRRVVALGSAALGALAALNGALTASPARPASQMPGEARRLAWDLGNLHYTVAGNGSPIVLVHGIGVAASSFEYRYVIEPLARTHRVFALDLLGFGLSDHPKIEFAASVFVKSIADFLDQEVRSPAVIVASGVSAVYSIEVAAQHPERVCGIALSAPGFPDGRPELPPGMRQAAGTLLGTPIVGQSLFLAMTARNSIRSYLRERAYSNPDLVTESMVDAQYAMAHQPNARLAPQAHLAGRLRIDATAALTRLGVPILLVVGSDCVPSPFPCVAEYVRLAAQTQVAVIDRCGALPHEEQPEQFAKTVLAWLGVSA